MICQCCLQPILDGESYDTAIFSDETVTIHEQPDICAARVAERAIWLMSDELGANDGAVNVLRHEFAGLIDYADELRRKNRAMKEGLFQ